MAKSERVYYSIGEVAEMFKVSTSLIRFWEKEFDVLKPHKNKKGNRLFTARDVKNLHIIYNLVKVKGYTLQGAREAIKADFEGLDRNITLLQTLGNMHKMLQELDSELAARAVETVVQKKRPSSK
ncbi:MAG: MerR family transcriptional regulator [Bacteroidia bacterium]|jgi:DNA-binding transcriptional MerR regulator|nr:MerR family transcriptional regulator [Bacteroidia bacterium]